MRITVSHFFISISLLFFMNCLPKKDQSDLEKLAEIQLKASDDLSGRELSEMYCGSCHLFPEPELLTVKVWKDGVLPQMGVRMGIRTEIKDPYEKMSPMDQVYVKQAKIFPDLPMISNLQWSKIKIFYLSNAPEELPDIERTDSVRNDSRIFEFRTVSLGMSAGSLTTLIRQDTADNSIFIGDGRNLLLELDTGFNIIEQHRLPSPPLDIEFLPNGDKLITCVGIIHPNEQPLGKLIKLDKTGEFSLVIENLIRPVNTLYTDLNNDGLEELVFSEYGNNLGHLSLFENKGNDMFQEKLLEMAPGSIQSYAHDFNKDGLPDIIALLAQGNEGIYILTNKNNNQFSSKQVLKFPPVYGSSYFELADMNKDGHMDIVYIHGDNADYSTILKPYHGVRIFMNDGENNFEESYFFPMHGASYGSVYDFDQDGDTDIGVIAFFPDFQEDAPENVIFLENVSTESLAFNAYAFEGTDQGRWIIMSRLDYDLDNDMDLVIGSFTFSPAPTPADVQKEWQRNNVSLGILENKLY